MLQPEWSQKIQTNHSYIGYQCQSHNQDPRPVAHKQKSVVTLKSLSLYTELQIHIFFLLKGHVSLFWQTKQKYGWTYSENKTKK